MTARPNGPVTHVVLIDGTFSSLMQGRRTNVGHIYRRLRQLRGDEGRLRVFYAAGQQCEGWRDLPGVAMGQGMGTRITSAYRWLAQGYAPGDRIFLIGYSRGAFAVRSLAGLIGRIGLLRPDRVTDRNIRIAWRFYRTGGTPRARAQFRARRCHDFTPIRFLGCFDTVMALGIRLPVLWALTEPRFRFHHQHLLPEVEYAVQALALDETRSAFQPILWTGEDHDGPVLQMWFRGAHADIGGQLNGDERARPLANIPLRWMISQAMARGLPMPEGWADGLDCDATAPSVGNWRGWGKAFLSRHRRRAGGDPTEALHPSVPAPYRCKARLVGHLGAPDMPHNAGLATSQQRRDFGAP